MQWSQSRSMRGSRHDQRRQRRRARSASLALEGITAVEVGGSLSGRLLAKLLVDQGAEISRIGLAGDPRRSYAFETDAIHRSLDSSSAAGREEFLSLVANADVVVDGLGGNGLSTFDLGPEELRAVNGRLISCTLTAMPEEAGGDRGELLEWLIAGELGLHQAGAAAPEREPLALVSAYGALQAAMYLVSGLIHRERHGSGSGIGVSLFGAAIMALNRRLINVADPKFRDPLW